MSLLDTPRTILSCNSHWHWDHVGDASRFHPDTEIVVGPSFKKNFMPGYPIRQDAEMLESDFE
jgi:glyoxylase-like metal-dependent hydrolase (beta-lactamase superfamily II)